MTSTHWWRRREVLTFGRRMGRGPRPCQRGKCGLPMQSWQFMMHGHSHVSSHVARANLMRARPSRVRTESSTTYTVLFVMLAVTRYEASVVVHEVATPVAGDTKPEHDEGRNVTQGSHMNCPRPSPWTTTNANQSKQRLLSPWPRATRCACRLEGRNLEGSK